MSRQNSGALSRKAHVGFVIFFYTDTRQPLTVPGRVLQKLWVGRCAQFAADIRVLDFQCERQTPVSLHHPALFRTLQPGTRHQSTIEFRSPTGRLVFFPKHGWVTVLNNKKTYCLVFFLVLVSEFVRLLMSIVWPDCMPDIFIAIIMLAILTHKRKLS